MSQPISASAAIRPSFQVEFEEAPEDVMNRLRSRLRDCPHCTGISIGLHAELFVLDEDRRLWSPHLSVTAEGDSDASRLRVRIGPHPSVWTWYMFCAFGLAFAFLVGTSFGYAQWMLGEKPWALISLPLCVIGGVLLYVSSLIGQRLGGEQIDGLTHALNELSRKDS